MKIVHVVRLDYKYINGIKTVITGLVPAQENLGHSVYVFNLRYNDTTCFKNEFYIESRIKFRSHINEICPDLVVFHGGYEIRYYIYASYLRKNNIPYIVVPHGGTSKYNLHKKRIPKTIINFLFTRYFLIRSAGIVFLNKNEKNNSIFCKIVKKYAIVPNGINIPKQDFNYKLALDKIVFIFLSRIDIKYKGLDILLEAVEKLQENFPEMNFEFRFYGGRYDPKIVNEFKNMIDSSNGPVSYYGEVRNEKKEEAYRQANIYVLPSLSEGMPITVLEALSYGCPCVVTPQTNMADIIRDYNAGWIAEPNVESITCVLHDAYSDYISNRCQYIRNSVNAVKSFSWNSVAEKSVTEYFRLISKPQ